MRYFCILVLSLYCIIPATAQCRHHYHRDCGGCREQSADTCVDCCCKPDLTVACYDSMKGYYKDYKRMIPEEIVYDFKTGIFLLPPNYNQLKVGDWVQVRVVNFNPLLFGVSVNSKDSLNKTVVDANNALAWATNPANLTALVAGLGAATNPPPAPAGATGKKPVPNNGQKPALPPPTATDTLRGILVNTYQTIAKHQDSAVTREHEYERKMHEYNQVLAVLKERYPTCQDFSYASSKVFRSKVENFFQSVRAKVDTDMGVVQLLETNYILATVPYSSLLVSGGLRTEDSLIKTYFTSSLAYLSKLDSNLSYKVLDSLLLPLRSLKDMKPCITTGELEYTKDIKTITLSFRAWTDSVHNPVSNPDPLVLPIVSQKVWGVSAGIYLSSMHNHEYTAKQDVNDTAYHLIPDNNGPVEIGIDALAYLGLKEWPVKPGSTNYNYIGLNYGAGVSLESKPKPRVMLGVGYIYGGANRIVISGGFIAGFVDRLSAIYSQNTAYSSTPSGYIKQVLCPGAFLSLNYSFTGN